MGQRVLQPIINQQVGTCSRRSRSRSRRRRARSERRRSPTGSPEAYEADPEGPTHNTETA
jgi:hypothetical protein